MTTSPDHDDLDPFSADLLEPGDSVIVSARGAGEDRLAALRPSSAARATPAQHEVLHDLQETALDLAQHQALLRALAAQARDLGISWGLIGWSVGLTSEGARQRYGSPEPSPRSSKPSRRRPR